MCCVGGPDQQPQPKPPEASHSVAGSWELANRSAGTTSTAVLSSAKSEIGFVKFDS